MEKVPVAVLPDSFGKTVDSLAVGISSDVLMAFEADADDSIDGVIGSLLVAEEKAKKMLELVAGMKTYATIVRNAKVRS